LATKGKSLKQRVVITEISTINPLGYDQKEITQKLLEGISGASLIKTLDPAQLPTRFAAEAKAPNDLLPIRDKKISFALWCANEILIKSKIQTYAASTKSCLSIGLGLELFSMDDMIHYLNYLNIPENVNPINFLQTPSDICVHKISQSFSFSHPPLTHVSACSAATDAIGKAFHLIREGKRDWVITGGSDSMINPLGLAGFCQIRAMSTRNEAPQKASRPFDKDRDGFLLGEGCALLLLESLEQAKKRKAKIYGEIFGFGNSFDAFGISEPHPDGRGASLAMARAIVDANLKPNQISYLNSHGTSTPKNDLVEAKAIHHTFGEHTKNIQVNATKSMIGHLISASGAVDMAANLYCGQKGYWHQTINLENLDPDCKLTVTKENPIKYDGGYILKNSFAFGGQNSSIVFKTNVETTYEN
jgi:3-oxoacyl-[acyl-carrier-protein] synthase II